MIHTSIYRILTKFIGFWGWQFQLMNISIHSGENDPQWLILWECVILPPPVRLFNVCQTFGSSGDPPVDFRKRLLQKGRFGNPMFVSGAGHFMTDDFSGKCMEKMERKSLIPGNHCLLQLIASQAEGPHLGQIPWRSHPKPSWWEVTPALCCPWYVMRFSHPKLPQSQHLASGGVPCFIPTDVQSTNPLERCILKSPTNLYNHPFLWLVVDLISRLQFWIWGYQPTQHDIPKTIQKTDVEFMSPSPPFLSPCPGLLHPMFAFACSVASPPAVPRAPAAADVAQVLSPCQGFLDRSPQNEEIDLQTFTLLRRSTFNIL